MGEQLKTDQDTLLCPFCGANYLHIEEVVVGTGEYSISMTADNTEIKHIKPSDMGIHRGAKIRLVVSCEICGVLSDINFGFHKGQILIEVLKSMRISDNSDLWRD